MMRRPQDKEFAMRRLIRRLVRIETVAVLVTAWLAGALGLGLATGAGAVPTALPLLSGSLSPVAAAVLDDLVVPDMQEVLRRWLDAYPDFGSEILPLEKQAAVLRRSRPGPSRWVTEWPGNRRRDGRAASRRGFRGLGPPAPAGPAGPGR
jgi:hypothetical protein